MVKKRADRAPRTPATSAPTRAGIAFTAHTYSHDPGSDLGYEPGGRDGARAAEHVFKALVVHVEGPCSPGLAVGVVPVGGQPRPQGDRPGAGWQAGGKRTATADGDGGRRTAGGGRRAAGGGRYAPIAR